MNNQWLKTKLTHSLFIVLLMGLLFIAPSNGQESNNFFCESNVVKCGHGTIAYCSDPTLTTTCLNLRRDLLRETVPDCCKQVEFGRVCTPSALVCPDSPDKFKNISAGIDAGPILPELETFPLTSSNAVIGSDVAFPGSNPSYVLNLPRELNSIVKTVELKDSSDTVFAIDNFTITDVYNKKKILVTLNIPSAISLGDAFFALNLEDGTTIVAKIRIIEPIKVAQSNSKKDMDQLKPIKVSRTQILGGGGLIRARVRASNLVGNKIFYLINDSVVKKQNKKSDPFTKVIILPRDLETQIESVRIKKKNKMAIKVLVSKHIPFNNQPIVIVLSSPESIISISTTLATIAASEEDNQNGITCKKGKPKCPDGRPAKCKNPDFTPMCSKQSGIPDCCKFTISTDRYKKLSPTCNAKSLFCSN